MSERERTGVWLGAARVVLYGASYGVREIREKYRPSYAESSGCADVANRDARFYLLKSDSYMGFLLKNRGALGISLPHRSR